MSDLSNVVELDGSGAVLIASHKPVGMITLKADLGNKTTSTQIKKALGVAVPKPRQIKSGVAWMAADELLIMVAEGDSTDEIISRLNDEIKAPILAVDVSEARAVFTLKGKGGREVLAKGAPIDLSPEAFGKSDFRRTRLGQVAVAFWVESEDEFRLICFASMREFMFDWLCNAAQKESLPVYF